MIRGKKKRGKVLKNIPKGHLRITKGKGTQYSVAKIEQERKGTGHKPKTTCLKRRLSKWLSKKLKSRRVHGK